MKEAGVVIVGAGHAGVQLAASLREAGYTGDIILVNDERHLPYQRPPLSKAFMLGALRDEGLCLRDRSFFAKHNIRILEAERATSLDRATRQIELASGEALSYEHLVLATGARNRPLAVEGSDLQGVFSLHSLDDAMGLRAQIKQTRNIVVIGGGFIGMEFAAVATKLGARVHVVEQAPRIMARAVSPEVSDYFTGRHQARGTRVSIGSTVTRIIGNDGRVTSVETVSGEELAADMVVVGIGVMPNVEIAAASGLATANGIIVDHHLLTADQNVSAIGDCAAFPQVNGDGMVRIESVQNAVDQARLVAARIAAGAGAYAAVPWFWTDQGDDRLQIAGITRPNDLRVIGGEYDAGRFSVYSFRNDALVAVESVNRAPDHMAARHILRQQRRFALSPDEVAEQGFNLKAYATREPLPA